MSRRIFKYEVEYGETAIELPIGAELLHAGTQRFGECEGVFLWALVDPEAPVARRDIGYFATGDYIPEGAEYVGTAITPDTAFVWHVYEMRGETC